MNTERTRVITLYRKRKSEKPGIVDEEEEALAEVLLKPAAHARAQRYVVLEGEQHDVAHKRRRRGGHDQEPPKER